MSVIGDRRQQLKHYTVSALFVIVAAVLTLAIRPYFDGKAPLFFFTIAVLFAAGYGGVGPGLLATALSLGIALLLFQDGPILAVEKQPFTIMRYSIDPFVVRTRLLKYEGAGLCDALHQIVRGLS